jgi:hypothetical protein
VPLIPRHEPADAVADMVRRRVPLPAAATGPEAPRPTLPPGRPLEEVLAGRTSVRDFTDEPVERAELAAVLARARAAQRDQWPAAVHGDPGLHLAVAARRVPGLAPGLYDWPADGTPRPFNPVPAPRDTLADTYTPAPVLVLVCGSVTRVGGAAAGGLLVRAGALGHAVWLAARTHGLECSVFGAAWAPARRAFPGSRHLFTVALGHPARP